ncbi:vasorin-like [Stegostoma tigrinum]|uniref:vasorin-like n=1 Tax=Stegostoma tigrinum TaxID=3053191 RepID=UPI00202AEBAA|nr:vasorin-like [Stegostoma tigrinum]
MQQTRAQYAMRRTSLHCLPWLTILVLLSKLLLVLCCPTECNCDPSGTLWCIKRGLSTIPEHIPPDTSSIYAFENSISTLHKEDFAELQKLKLLHLSHNKITRLPHEVFQSLSVLSNLDLSSNQITEINNNTFMGLQELERLYLQQNKIKTIHAAAFDTLTKLVELKLQDNLLHHLPPLQLPTLLLLDLSRNNIPDNDLRSIQAPEIESLKLAGLGLSTIDEDIFKNMKNLQELDLSENQLVTVSAILQHLSELTFLSVRGNNKMSHLKDEDFKHIRNLQKLDISGLSLRTIPEGFLELFSNLRSLTAAENPYNCVCQISWFVQWIQENNALLQRQEETRCHFPLINSGKPLNTLTHGDFGCPTTIPSISATSTTELSPTTAKELTLGHKVTHPPGQSMSFNGRVTLGAITETDQQLSAKGHLCLSTECLNGGICRLDKYGHHSCMCRAGFYGPFCEAANGILDLQTSQKNLLNISQITSTSVTLNLEGFRLSPVYYKGLRVTYKNWSGLDPRPVSLNIPISLSTYKIPRLWPNSTYQICVGALGEASTKEQPCTFVQTLPITQLAQFKQAEDSNLTRVIWLVTTGMILVLLLAVVITLYCRKRLKKNSAQGGEPHPYDVEEIKPYLEEGKILSDTPECLALQSEVPLIKDHQSNIPIAL